MLILLNPATPFRADANTEQARESLYPLGPELFCTACFILCPLCLLTISGCELPSCLCGPTSEASPSICKDEGLIKTIFPINIPGSWSPSSSPPPSSAPPHLTPPQLCSDNDAVYKPPTWMRPQTGFLACAYLGTVMGG